MNYAHDQKDADARRNAKDIFNDALDLPPHERAGFVDRACSNDPALRERVLHLLKVLESGADFLAAATVQPDPFSSSDVAAAETPESRDVRLVRAAAGEVAALATESEGSGPHEGPGSAIGPYKLLERIGEGGFGTVYLAEQKEPVRRRVAVKVIKLGMDTRQVIARFEAERQALAMMDHPHIARVLDAGATDAGRPYFVMELVKGVPITQYCDEQRVTLPQRLALFTDVCHAVQHAHQKGIIHRDLKPSNVLVSRHDDKPVVKVIDFGIVKATGARLTDKTLHTEWRQLIGTPAYMSPEQAGMSDLDVDTRSDIYSLGVLLYELLTGTPPFDPQQLLSAGFDEMRRIIREVEPPKPSTRVDETSKRQTVETSQRGWHGVTPQAGRHAIARAGDHADASGDGMPPAAGDRRADRSSSALSTQDSALAIAQHRRTDPQTLSRSLRGDLDWIVMKCLEKDRTRRYETASGLALDVQRHRSGEPVLAAPPSASYRVMKFARRHKAGVIAASSVLAALLLGMAGTTFGLLRAEQRRVEAVQAQGRERQQHELAEKQRELAEKREKQTQQVSEFQAAMLGKIDVEAMGRGIKQRFREQVRSALERQYVGEYPNRRKRTPEEIETELAAFDQRADAAQVVDVARGVMDEFVLARAADALEKQFADQPLVQAQLHLAIGQTYKGLGLYSAAEPHLLKAVEIEKRQSGEAPELLELSVSELGNLRSEQGDYAAAESLHRESVALCRTLYGEESWQVATAMGNLSQVMWSKGDAAEAERLIREVLARRLKLIGDEHPDVAKSMSDVASFLGLGDRGDYAAAEPLYTEALAILRKAPEDGSLAVSLNDLAILLSTKGDYAAAEPLLREALAINRKLPGNEHPNVAFILQRLAHLLHDKRDDVGAEALYREALAINRKVLGDEHPDVVPSLDGVAQLLEEKGDYAAAEPLFREALAINRKVFGDEHPDVARSMNNLAVLLMERGDYAAAEALQTEALAIVRKAYGYEHHLVATALQNLGSLIGRRGDYARAAPLLREALAIRRKLLGDEHPDVSRSLNELGAVLAYEDDYAAAEPLLREALAMRRKLLGDAHPDVAETLEHLGALLHVKGDSTAAAVVFREALTMRREHLPDHHPALAWVLHHIADDLRAMREFDEAEKSARQAVEIYRANADPSPGQRNEHRHAVDILSQTLVDAGKPDEAIPIRREFVEDLRRLLPAGGLSLASALAPLGPLLLQQGKYAEAEPILRELLAIREKALRPDSPEYWLLANTRSTLGGALAGQGAALIESDAPAAISKFTEAEPLLVEAGGWLTRSADRIPQDVRAERLRQALERIVRLYESWDTLAPDSGKAEQAAEWRAELEKLPGP